VPPRLPDALDRRWPHSPRFGRYNVTYLPEDQPTAVDAVAGAFMLLPAAVVRRVGAWDEEFFAYGEDIDYCLRVKQAGWLVWYEPSVTVLHLKGAISQQRSLRMIGEFYRAMRVYYRKHQAPGHPLPVRLLILGGIWLFQALALLRQRRRALGRRRPPRRRLTTLGGRPSPRPSPSGRGSRTPRRALRRGRRESRAGPGSPPGRTGAASGTPPHASGRRS
jgi:GT2 family glycosyltransferase